MAPLSFFYILLLAAAAALLAYMEYVEPRQRQFNSHRVQIRKKLPRPFRILHLTDTHFAGPNAPLAAFFDRLVQETYDFIFVTGDIMDCDAGLPYCLENFKKLKSKYGTFAVFGNHDYFDFKFFDAITHNFPGQPYPRQKNNVDLFAEEFKKIGVRALRNETVSLQIDGVPVLIHGLDDPTTGHANLRRTMENFDPSKVHILLTHTVDAFLDIGENEIDLSFSGHSHGGQVRLPFWGPVITHTRIGRRYASGIHTIQGAVCCIGRGLNASRFLFIRLLCPPEAILLTVEGGRT